MKKIFNWLILLSLVLGILCGLFIPNIANNLSFLGTIYINLLKLMIIPIIFTSIIVTIYNYHSKITKHKILIKAVVMYIIIFVITFLLTSLVIWLINPARGVQFNQAEWTGGTASLNVSDIIVGFFPSNVVTIIENNSIFACILLAFFMGLAASKVENGKKVIDFFDSLKNILYKLLEWIIYLTPIGAFSLVSTTVASFGAGIIGVGVKYIGAAYLCSILALILTVILPVWIHAKINPIVYVKKLWKLWIITITTCSSAAALPYTIRTCNEELGVSSNTTDIVSPIGCAIYKVRRSGLFCNIRTILLSIIWGSHYILGVFDYDSNCCTT